MIIVASHIPIVVIVILVKIFTRLLLAVAVIYKDILLQHIVVQLNDNSTKEQCPYSDGMRNMILQMANI